MTTQVEFGNGNQQYLRVRRSAEGGLSVASGPITVLSVPLELSRIKETVDVEVDRLAMWLSMGGTLIGVGELGPCPTFFGPSDLHVKFRLPQAALPLLLEPPPAAGKVQLAVRMTGQLRFRHNKAAADQPDGWQTITVYEHSVSELDIGVARSDWYDQVVSPLRLGSCLVVALKLPDPQATPSWAGSIARLHDAERALTNGESAAAFGQCRGAFDALPNAKRDMYRALPEGPKRTAIDALAAAVGRYLHEGRHVVPAGGGTEEGDFPVDQVDARFAYHLTQLLLSHTASLTLDA